MLFAQGWLLEHPPAQIVPAQLFAPQLMVWTAGQAPFPSQLAARVAVPAVQLAGRQFVLAPGKPQAVRVVPSHDPAQAVPAPAQAAWPVRGAPLTAAHVPLLAVSAQASHWPLHAALQQTPSAQYPVTHAVAAVHGCPCLILHAPLASQALLPVQVSASSALVTATHVPPPPVQAWQVPHEAVPQQ